MERVSWIQNGSKFSRVQGNVSNVEQIPVGIYNINFNPMAGWSLEKTSDKFSFDYKVYGLQTKFVAHVLKTFKSTKGNFGILLNGTKGTGKTVTAKVLANEFNLPIIIVKSFGDNNDALMEYIASFNFDCVLFFDEFEKTWSAEDSSILQIMDGVYTSPYRRIFLLTTNQTYINENLLSRPSRLRYVKEFGNLEQSVVREYLQDNLKDSECLDCVMDFVDTLQISTIDILKTIVEDINIHGFDTFMENKDIFNVKTATYSYRTITTRFSDIAYVQSIKYDVEKFCKDVKAYETVTRPYEYMYATQEEFEEACIAYRKNCCKRDLRNREICSQKSFRAFKVGEIFGYYGSEVIINIDEARHVVVTRDSDGEITFYFIQNPAAKPSLYSASQSYTDPYYSVFKK